ncbi:YXWGXW repeat-containing protein [Pendulispora rubella]|uniref:YXWGXW repeat-containing protein n=1 Tax=Pendulispora rubella TaxID=2741070 RepID=A0ABZ2KYR0_9BACT
MGKKTAFVSLLAPAVGGTAVGWLFACGPSRLPAPKYVGQDTSALMEVPYPPPPAHTERVPESPAKGAVWLDGEWVWDGRRWSWRQGRWVMAPSNAKFSPWTTVRGHDGTLYFASGVWKDAGGKIIADPKPLLGARTGSSPIVGPEGEPFPTGATIQAIEDAGADGGDRGDKGGKSSKP